MLQRLHDLQQVFPLLQRSDVEQVALRQPVSLHSTVDLLGRVPLGEHLVASLIDHLNLGGVDAEQPHDVALRALAHRYDPVGTPAGRPKFPGVDPPVHGLVAAGQDPEDQVVNGHHTADAPFREAVRQFVAQSVEERHAVALQLRCHGEDPPERGETAPERTVGQVRRNAVQLQQSVVLGVGLALGNIEVQPAGDPGALQRPDDEAAVISESGAVRIGPFGFEADNRIHR